MKRKKDFLSITDLKTQEIWEIFLLAKKIKQELKTKGANKPILYGKTLVTIFETDDPYLAVTNADLIVTDTWVSMGDEREKEKRLKIFQPYQVNKSLMELAKKDAIFLHCLGLSNKYLLNYQDLSLKKEEAYGQI